MLIDDVTITVKAGKGGDGVVSFRRNAQTAKGGPDGGNGGNGGSVFFQGSDDLTVLAQFSYKKLAKAAGGIPGKKKNLYGKNALHLTVLVPLGTTITDVTTNTVYNIIDKETRILIAQGGKGGRGNNEFKSATNQTPRYRELGQPGEEKTVRLELKLIAQVGLIGLPNAGKSSLLKALTNANPKIGNYPFTTLEPNLGVMDGIILADVPGLIEGASEGKGLGHKFLKHVEKTKLLLHCVDVTNDDVVNTYQTVRIEFAAYNKQLLEKQEIIILTKCDLVDLETITKQKEKLQQFSAIILTTAIDHAQSLETVKKVIKGYTA